MRTDLRRESLRSVARTTRDLEPAALEAALIACVVAAEERDRELGALCAEPDRRERVAREARACAAQWPDPARRPALFGVPIGVKDLFGVAGLATMAGSELPPEALAGPPATAVTRLAASGAIVLAKTTTDELAYADPPPTRNPHDASRTPGGSSAGSAAGVAAGLFPVALGTQTTRSILAPAAFCGVVGFKCSHGRIPMDGVVPLAPSLDSVGLLAADVASVAAAAPALFDGWRIVAPRVPVLRIAAGAYLDGLAALGWRAPFERAVARLRDAGLPVEDVRLPWDDELEGLYGAAMTVLHGELARAHGERVARHPDRFRARTKAGVARGSTVSDADLARARALGLDLRNRLGDWTERAGVDLLLAPSQPGPAPLLGDRTGFGDTTTPWSFAGLPCLGLPAGAIDGLPFGLMLVARHGADEELLDWGATIERALGRL